MNYLEETTIAMKEEILLIHRYLKNAKTQKDVAVQMSKLEKLIKDRLIQSFKNGIEVGRKKRGGRQNYRDRR